MVWNIQLILSFLLIYQCSINMLWVRTKSNNLNNRSNLQYMKRRLQYVHVTPWWGMKAFECCSTSSQIVLLPAQLYAYWMILHWFRGEEEQSLLLSQAAKVIRFVRWNPSWGNSRLKTCHSWCIAKVEHRAGCIIKVNPVKYKSEVDSCLRGDTACVIWICSFSRNKMSQNWKSKRPDEKLKVYWSFCRNCNSKSRRTVWVSHITFIWCKN